MTIPHRQLVAVLVALGGWSCSSDDTGPPGGQPGTLQLATTTTGVQTDDDGYTVMVDGAAHGTIGSNDTLTVPDVGTGSHTVELSQISFNCATLGAFTRSVTVSETAGANVEYSVECDTQSRSRIAYSAPSDSVSDEAIIVVNADGSDPTSLTDLVGAIRPRRAAHPAAWSGDGGKVAFTRSDSALYVANADGTGVTQVAPAGFSPTWSRDGETVAFLVDETEINHDTCCRDNLFVATPGGAGVSRVTDIRELFAYDFAANGAMLAYEQGVTSHTLTVHADGTGTTPIESPDICCLQAPSLSPDGSMVAYFAYPNDQSGNLGYEVYVSRSDGSGTPLDVSNNEGDDAFPDWSPDGTRIAFVNSAGTLFAQGALHVVNADGTNQQNLTPVDVVTDPSWSPDGTRIAYTGFVSGEPHIYVANADGSGRVDITPNRPASRPMWTGR